MSRAYWHNLTDVSVIALASSPQNTRVTHEAVRWDQFDRLMSHSIEVFVMPTTKRTYARYTTEAIGLLGNLVRLGRKRRKMTEMELAERLGIARSTLQRMEKGDPKVEVGIIFEAAALVGVKLFDSDEKEIAQLSGRVNDRIAVLPKHIYKKSGKIVDDF